MEFLTLLIAMTKFLARCNLREERFILILSSLVPWRPGGQQHLFLSLTTEGCLLISWEVRKDARDQLASLLPLFIWARTPRHGWCHTSSEIVFPSFLNRLWKNPQELEGMLYWQIPQVFLTCQLKWTMIISELWDWKLIVLAVILIGSVTS